MTDSTDANAVGTNALITLSDVYVAGHWVRVGDEQMIDLVDSSTEDAFARAPLAEIEVAVAAARAAFDSGPWPAMSRKKRMASGIGRELGPERLDPYIEVRATFLDGAPRVALAPSMA